MKFNEFEQYLNALLKPEQIKDYCPNGLQIAGTNHIQKVVTGVTANQALIERAIEEKADALIVHHGYFWKNESYVIKGMKHKRIKALLLNDINLFGYHLPLDIHPELGNNAQLAKLFGIDITGPLEIGNAQSVSLQGKLKKPTCGEDFATMINEKLNRKCLHIAPNKDKKIQTIAWCSGGGQNFIELAAEQGIDAFISGEISEQTTHVAREMNIHYFAAGHHATERYGAKALAKKITEDLSIEAIFIDIDNPA
ncbi:Nif3-like dinuclear metal center hexameric protein [Thalassotalea sp. 1_MG-2023]|uniref:Nif3-like dinuclear metal center hexameric protein n=1 Tax=Thalassotalea sp. 1_MG-2023 TaxID=3062680 RepID=UPI0026E3D98C|nr:Nif3-like dinuclear metal center hexameric protein [Thalassotalea sp. 1_MG-2023]MDO6427791.1 Nif3-like dinuclear metal center hexameric protein [Thalassotalea sp. 1_MG-2023]